MLRTRSTLTIDGHLGHRRPEPLGTFLHRVRRGGTLGCRRRTVETRVFRLHRLHRRTFRRTWFQPRTVSTRVLHSRAIRTRVLHSRVLGPGAFRPRAGRPLGAVGRPRATGARTTRRWRRRALRLRLSSVRTAGLGTSACPVQRIGAGEPAPMVAYPIDLVISDLGRDDPLSGNRGRDIGGPVPRSDRLCHVESPVVGGVPGGDPGCPVNGSDSSVRNRRLLCGHLTSRMG